MASSKDYLEYVIELLREAHNITYKKMMGYQDSILFSGAYDNRFLIKKTKALKNSNLKEQIPCQSAKRGKQKATQLQNTFLQLTADIPINHSCWCFILRWMSSDSNTNICVERG